MRFFNTAGPINPKDHYYIPHRLDEKVIMQLIIEKKYFILHAPRQSGKTTAIRVLVNQLNVVGKYKAFYINIEAAQAARNNIVEGMRTILDRFKAGIESAFPDDIAVINYLDSKVLHPTVSGNALYSFLQFWSQNSTKQLILFIDEIDSLVGDTLISVLRQLRDGYANRSVDFPSTVCLVGVRDVRDYRIWSETDNNMVLGGSAFNIKSESLVLNNFSREQIADLYTQHTAETGQQFTDEAIDYAFELTQGQPWLVNALAYQACFRDITDRAITITKETIEHAKETLILRRDTHIDVLIDRLEEPRVRDIIDVIISGQGETAQFKIDDMQYVRDLGLIDQKSMKIANPIYQEIIPRELAYTKQQILVQEPLSYINPDGSFNTDKMIQEFAQFFRQNSDIWLEKFAYKESGPHILLMAFLQRVINGGGKIHREYALGRGRVDLFIEFKTQKIVIEIKIKRGEKAITQGLEQTAQYMDANNATEGHLIIFDRNVTTSWDERIYQRIEHVGNKKIAIWGM